MNVQCPKCKHYNRALNTCKAFPEKIPTLLPLGIIKHDKVLEGQTGDYVFEMLDFYKKKEEKEKIREERAFVDNEERMKLLPKLLLDSIRDQKYPITLLEKIVFKLYLSSVPKHFDYHGLISTQDIDVTPNSFPVKRHFKEDSEIFRTAVPIVLRERNANKNNYMELTVYADGNYNYEFSERDDNS